MGFITDMEAEKKRLAMQEYELKYNSVQPKASFARTGKQPVPLQPKQPAYSRLLKEARARDAYDAYVRAKRQQRIEQSKVAAKTIFGAVDKGVGLTRKGLVKTKRGVVDVKDRFNKTKSASTLKEKARNFFGKSIYGEKW